MCNENIGRLTALAYFLLLNIGVAFSMAGVVTKDIAAWFSVDTYVIGYIFTLFSVGYSVAILGNGFVLERLNVRLETVLAAGIVLAALVGAAFLPTLYAFAAAVFIYGVGLGVLCSVGYYLIVNLYNESARPGKLNVLNFFFSAGAIVTPFLAGLALKSGVKWQLVYQAAVPLVIAVLIWATLQNFTMHPVDGNADADVDDKWGIAVYVIGLALFCYVISEMIFSYWVVVYMMERLGMDVAVAGAALSIFWTLMAVGRLAAGKLIDGYGIRRYLIFWGVVAFAAFAGLLMVTNGSFALGLVGVMGLSYSGLFATTMAYGTLQVPHPSSKLTTFFLTIGAAGGILSFLLSSWLKQSFDVVAVLGLAAVLIGLFAFLVVVAPVKRNGQARTVFE